MMGNLLDMARFLIVVLYFILTRLLFMAPFKDLARFHTMVLLPTLTRYNARVLLLYIAHLL